MDCFVERKYDIKQWKNHHLNPKKAEKSSVDWIFLVDTLNFCFWSKNKEGTLFSVDFEGKIYNGYWSLCAAVNRALQVFFFNQCKRNQN